MKGFDREVFRRTWSAGLSERPLVITSFVSVLALGMLGGCSSTGKGLFAGDNVPREQSKMAALANDQIDPAASRGVYDDSFYQAQAQEIRMPSRWLSEAQTSSAASRARRAAAQSAMVTLRANESQAFSAADSRLRGALTSHEIAGAESMRMDDTFKARLYEMGIEAQAVEEANMARTTREAERLDAAVSEWAGEYAALRSEATGEWEFAQSQHAQLIAARAGTYDRGRAEIDEMNKVADLTENRAAAKVADLRARAQSVGELTNAEIESLGQQIETVRTTTSAESSGLRERAAELNVAALAEVDQLNAKADALEKTGVDQQYRLDVSNANAEFAKAEATSQQMIEEAQSFRQKVHASVSGMRSEAGEALEVARAQWESEQVSIEKFEDQGWASINARRAEANKIEQQARAAFVKAEASARAEAVREQALHQVKLSEDEFKKIKAEAETEASRVRAAFMQEFAKRVASGQVTMPAMTNPGQNVSPSDATPAMSAAAEKPAYVDPSRIASFKTQLGESAMLHRQADASEAALRAGIEERGAEVSSWWDQQLAAHEAALAQAQAEEIRGEAEVAHMIAQGEAVLAKARATHTNNLAIAQSNQQETIATIASLRAQAELTRKESTATVAQLYARSEAIKANGIAEAERLEVQRDAASRRGSARQKQLMAEAASLEQSQGAVVAQMRQDIEASNQMLAAEVAKLDAAAEAFIAVARADFDEQMMSAETHARFADATKTEVMASNDAERMAGDARVVFLRQIAEANQLISDAEVARSDADAKAQLAIFQAQDLTDRAQITSQSMIAEASVQAEHAIANAEDEATRALFEARVAQTVADRNRALASVYQSEAQQSARAEQAASMAQAYMDMSNHAIAQMEQRQADFSQTARDNWNSVLAMSPEFPTPATNEDLYMLSESALFQPVFDPSQAPNQQVITSVWVEE